MREVGLSSHPASTEGELKEILLAERDPEPDPVNGLRDGMMRFILRHWRVTRSQITCPAKSGDPKACYGCPDAQVYFCVTAQSEEARNEIENG